MDGLDYSYCRALVTMISFDIAVLRSEFCRVSSSMGQIFIGHLFVNGQNFVEHRSVDNEPEFCQTSLFVDGSKFCWTSLT